MLAPNSVDVAGLLQQARALMPMRKRGANTALYDALEIAMRVCELCDNDINQDVLLGKMIAELPKGNKNRQIRRTLQRHLSARVPICNRVPIYIRGVLFTQEHALREAAKRQVHSSELKARLNSGGVNQFYLVRPLHNDFISTKCIRLSKNITHPKEKVFTLRTTVTRFWTFNISDGDL